MSEISALWPVAPASEARWLVELNDDPYGTTGFQVPSGLYEDAAWVLNAMYEHVDGPGELSRDALVRSSREAMGAPVPCGVYSGGLGRAEHPGGGYRRLRWAELARRTGDPVVAPGYLPSYRSAPDGRLPDGGWPAGLETPTEGALDRPTWDRLIEVLIAHSPEGAGTRCLAFYNPLLTEEQDFDDHRVLAGRLGDAFALYDHPGHRSSPSNLWPEDRSWVTYTDWDLWGTKVAGPAALIGALLGDHFIEAVRLPWDS
ncbi:hypothetical protein GCM10010218_29130 [Streptomyces mashuensis]|uniref:Uncharacterized protein n=1 Tax=Streptomyces mashuensis TaxID=33904 RepID=A0A919B3R2_9ACTN|nr:hypothetical protein [Streptomyces mashuensis]GHF46068.1 hypothetical protein GCM10010218_29130 [Streptomyces mashuensis]